MSTQLNRGRPSTSAQNPVKRTPNGSAAAPLRSTAQSVESKPGKGDPTLAQIAEAAYFLWKERGGNETVNWLEAERQLKSKSGVKSGR